MYIAGLGIIGNYWILFRKKILVFFALGITWSMLKKKKL